MTTAMERKIRREERRLKEEKRRAILFAIWAGLKYAGAAAGAILASTWLAIAMWDNAEWALNISWGVASLVIGAALFYKVRK